jgi:hypothetical protein
MGKIHKSVVLAVLIALSFVFGLTGIRYLVIVIIPCLAVCFFMLVKSDTIKNLRDDFSLPQMGRFLKTREGYLFMVCIVTFLVSAIGYWVNIHVLPGIFIFENQASVKLLNGAQLFDRLQGVIKGALDAIGYRGGSRLFSFDGIVGVLTLLLAALSIYCVARLMKKRAYLEEYAQKFLLYFCIVSFLENFLVFVFIRAEFASRYYIPVLIFSIPVFAVYLYSERAKVNKALAGLAVCVIFIVCGFNTIFVQYNEDGAGNERRSGHIAYLENEEYVFGYSTYWNANILTELSNGQIEVANLRENLDQLTLYYWVSPKKLYDRDYHEGKTFLLLTTEEENEFGKSMPVLDKMERSYSDDAFVVYTCPDISLVREYISDDRG